MNQIKIENKKYKKLRINLSHNFNTNYTKIFTKNKQVDTIILNYLEDDELNNVCFINKYIYYICQTEDFWNYRFQKKYLKYLSNINILKYKKEKNWKDYYIRLSSFIYDDFPYFIFLVAKQFRRKDVIVLLKKLRNVEEDFNECPCHDCNTQKDCVECSGCYNCGKLGTCVKHCICRCYMCYNDSQIYCFACITENIQNDIINKKFRNFYNRY